jgi:hypothetical protein
MMRGVLVLCVALILLTEAVLRWGVGLGNPPLVRLDPATEYELIGPAEYSRWGNRISVNAQGIRGPAFDEMPTATERRVLLIGDSVIYGGHFIDQVDTVAAHVTTQLAGMPQLDGCEPVALPMAASSWGPVNQQAFLSRSGSFGAQAAVIIVSAHDLYDTPQGAAEILPYRTHAPLSALTDAGTAVLERLFPAIPEGPALTLDQSVEQTIAALDAMTTALRNDGIKPILIYHPTMSERSFGLRDAAGIFQDWAIRSDIRFVNFATVPISAASYQDDIHPNAQGTPLLARLLTDAMVADLGRCSG